MFDQLKLLFGYYVNPRRAVSETLDHGKILAVAALAIMTGLALQVPRFLEGQALDREFTLATSQFSAQQMEKAQAEGRVLSAEELQAALQRKYAERFARAEDWRQGGFGAGKALAELFVVVGLFVPLGIALVAAWEGRSVGRVLQEEFGAVAMCMALAWTAARAPVLLLLGLPRGVEWGYWVSTAVFVVFAALVLRGALGARWVQAGSSAVIGGGVILASGWIGVGLSPFLYLVASPLLIYYFWGSLSSGVAGIGAGVSGRQSFQRALEATTLNPRDADAQAQLGHIQVKRRNWKEAEARYRKAYEIDPDDADYAFHLGSVLREQGRDAEAKEFLVWAASRNEKTSSWEVLRELGAAQLALGETVESLKILRRYVGMREYDPVGLVYLGEALEKTGDPVEARQMWERAVVAVKTMPGHRRGELRSWAGRAQAGLKRLG